MGVGGKREELIRHVLFLTGQSKASVQSSCCRLRAFSASLCRFFWRSAVFPPAHRACPDLNLCRLCKWRGTLFSSRLLGRRLFSWTCVGPARFGGPRSFERSS